MKDMKECEEARWSDLWAICADLLNVANDWDGQWGTPYGVGERLREIEARFFRVLDDSERNPTATEES